MRAGLPVVMLEAIRARRPSRFPMMPPGRWSRIPLQPGAAVDVREHQLVVATSRPWATTGTTAGSGSAPGGRRPRAEAGGVRPPQDGPGPGRTRYRRPRRAARRRGPRGVYPVGRYRSTASPPATARVGPGPVGGIAFVRDLAEGESILVKPPALLFKDPTVGMAAARRIPRRRDTAVAHLGNRYLWLRIMGPGRIGLQSSYERLEDPGSDFLGEQPVHPAPLDLSEAPGRPRASCAGRPELDAGRSSSTDPLLATTRSGCDTRSSATAVDRWSLRRRTAETWPYRPGLALRPGLHPSSDITKPSDSCRGCPGWPGCGPRPYPCRPARLCRRHPDRPCEPSARTEQYERNQ